MLHLLSNYSSAQETPENYLLGREVSTKPVFLPHVGAVEGVCVRGGGGAGGGVSWI